LSTKYTYKILTDTLEQDRKQKEEVKARSTRLKILAKEVAKVKEEIQEQLEEKRRDEASQLEMIEKLKEELQEYRVIT
jgi:hypothetical protein